MFNTNVPGEMEKAEKAGEDILKLCVEAGGCLTGEHGVGIEKRDLMTYQFNAVDLEQQMRSARDGTTRTSGRSRTLPARGEYLRSCLDPSARSACHPGELSNPEKVGVILR
jgi:hypothetical protein